MSWRYWALLALCVGTGSKVRAQTSDVTTCVDAMKWMINPKDETPCMVAADVQSLCGRPSRVDLIPVGTHYTGPAAETADACTCSSVAYSLVSACGICQGRNIGNYTAWTINCPANLRLVSAFPQAIREEIDVPPWAFLDIRLTNDAFNVALARQNATGTPPTQSLTSSSPTFTPPTIVTNTAPNNSNTAPSTQGGSSTNAGAIAGGVVGGIAFIALVALFLVWKRIRERNSMSKNLAFSPQDLVAEKPLQPAQTGTTVTYNSSGPFVGPGSTVMSQYEPSVYPTSAYPAQSVYTTPGNNRSLESVTPSMAVHQQGHFSLTPVRAQPAPLRTTPAGYNRAAEV